MAQRTRLAPPALVCVFTLGLLPVFLPACGGKEKPPEAPKAATCPDDTIELSRGGKRFCMERTEVTVNAYLECVGKAQCSAASEGRECNRDTLQAQSHPVNCVDATQAEGFCAYRGRRLPTEQEWEWAAGGAGKGAPEPAAGACWSGGMPQHATCATDRRGAQDNGLGIHDLAGNVAEWTSSGDAAHRVVRGGAYSSNAPADLKPDARRTVSETTRHPGLGFRCVVSLGGSLRAACDTRYGRAHDHAPDVP